MPGDCRPRAAFVSEFMGAEYFTITAHPYIIPSMEHDICPPEPGFQTSASVQTRQFVTCNAPDDMLFANAIKRQAEA